MKRNLTILIFMTLTHSSLCVASAMQLVFGETLGDAHL